MNYILAIALLICLLSVFYIFNTYDLGKINSISKNRLEIIAVSIVTVFMAVTLSAFLLAVLGIFYAGSLIISSIIEVIVVFVYCIKRKKLSGKRAAVKIEDIFCVGIICICGVIYFSNVTECLWGGRDPGIYLIKGVNIAKTHSLSIKSNAFIDCNYEWIKNIISLEYRGSYSDFLRGDTNSPGKLTLQFLDYFPAVLAIGYLLDGLQGVFHTNAIIAVISILMCYLMVSNLFGKKVGLIVTIILGINPAQIWSARITQTEIAYQLFWFTSLYLFFEGWDESNKKIALLSGIIIGLTGLNRIDSYIFGIAISLVGIYCALFYLEKKKYILFMEIGYFCSSVICILYSYCFSKYYFYDHWKSAGLKEAICLDTILFAVQIVLSYKKQLSDKFRNYDLLTILSDSKYKRLCFCGILCCIVKWFYFVRPTLQSGIDIDADFNKRALAEMTWYTTGILLVSMIFGIYYILKKWHDNKSNILFLASGMMMLIIYVLRPGIAPDHIWASRRWISVCIPFVIIVGIYGLNQFFKKVKLQKSIKKTIYVLIIIAIMVKEYSYSRIFLNTTILGGFEAQYEQLIAALQDDKVYFAEQTYYASVLRFVYGKNVLLLNEECSGEDILEYIKQTHQEVYVIGGESVLDRLKTEDLKYTQIYNGRLYDGVWLEEVVADYPDDYIKVGAYTNIYLIEE